MGLKAVVVVMDCESTEKNVDRRSKEEVLYRTI
jgi:hypothetical protein